MSHQQVNSEPSSWNMMETEIQIQFGSVLDFNLNFLTNI